MRRLKTVRRPPIYPKTPGHLPYSLTHPLPLSSRRPSVSFGGFGLTNSPEGDYRPVWSPDGSKIAFYSWRDGNREIYTMNANGSNQTNVTRHPADDWYPTWSPDGLRIAFTSFRDGNREIYVMNADGSRQRNSSNNPADDWAPSWGP